MTTIQSASTTDLAETVKDRAAAPIGTGETLQEFVRKQLPEIGRGLPPGTLTAERFIRTVLTEIRRNPQLGDCTRESFLGSMFQAAQLGLEPGSALGQAFLIPFRDKNKGVTDCTFLIGYKGWVAVAARSGILLESREVRENDDFRFQYGTSAGLEHSWDPRIPRGDVVFYYGTASMPDGRTRFQVMSMDEIEARKNRSAAVKSGRNSPWSTDYDAMCRKTVIRAMVPQLPMSAEMSNALAADEGIVKRDQGGDLRVSFPDAIDIPPAREISEAAQELLSIIAETEPPAEKHNLSSYLLNKYGPISGLTDEQVQEATDIALGWPETKPAEEPPEAPESAADTGVSVDGHADVESPPPYENEGDPGPSDPYSGHRADVPPEVLEVVTRAVSSWPEEIVRTKAREWELSPRANAAIGKLRTDLIAVLASACADGNEAAQALF